MSKLENFKEIISKILWSSKEKQEKQFYYFIDDYFITTLIVLNIFAIILESYENLQKQYDIYFFIFELFSVIIFSLEYLLRLWTSNIKYKHLGPFKSRIRYIFSAFGLIDLFAILPFYIPYIIKADLRFLRILRLMRLFRILKLGEYMSSLQLIGKVLFNKKEELLITVFTTFILILLTASIMFHIEHDVQPEKFPDIISSFWWAIATLTTIGYGDVYPITGLGKLLAAITAVFGIGLVAIPTGIISSGLMEELKERKSSSTIKNDDFILQNNYCPYCDKKLEN